MIPAVSYGGQLRAVTEPGDHLHSAKNIVKASKCIIIIIIII